MYSHAQTADKEGHARRKIMSGRRVPSDGVRRSDRSPAQARSETSDGYDMKLHGLNRAGLLTAAWCAAALLPASSGAGAGQGYLSLVGPPAPRFEPPPPVAPAPEVSWPPLVVVQPRLVAPADELPTSVIPTPSVPQSPASTDTRDSIFTDPFTPPGDGGASPTEATNVTAAAPAETQTLVPQMFLKYFTARSGTNLSGVSIYAPVGFIPPQPVVAPSSSAAFQTTPAPKP
jgi:hypothetical protein